MGDVGKRVMRRLDARSAPQGDAQETPAPRAQRHDMGAKVERRLRARGHPESTTTDTAAPAFTVGPHSGGGMYPVLGPGGGEVDSVRGKEAAQERADELANEA